MLRGSTGVNEAQISSKTSLWKTLQTRNVYTFKQDAFKIACASHLHLAQTQNMSYVDSNTVSFPQTSSYNCKQQTLAEQSCTTSRINMKAVQTVKTAKHCPMSLHYKWKSRRNLNRWILDFLPQEPQRNHGAMRHCIYMHRPKKSGHRTYVFIVKS